MVKCFFRCCWKILGFNNLVVDNIKIEECCRENMSEKMSGKVAVSFNLEILN